MLRDQLPTTAEELKQQEAEATAALASSTERMWAATQALLQRCAVRSALGDRQGALQDAKSALGTTPDRPEYLIQTAQALIDANHGEQAFEAYQRVTAAVRGSDDHDDALDATLATLDRRLRPHHGLPDEKLASIFEWVYLDWPRVPSPFQLVHVCSRWRRIACSTPSLWRDTRILRVAVRLPCEGSLSIPTRKPYCMPDISACPNDRTEHPRGSLHGKLLDFCADKSRDTITHYEIELSSVHPDWEAFDEVLASASHLESVSIINHDKEYDLVEEAMSLIFKCPKLAALELSLGESQSHDSSELRKVKKGWSSAPTLRTLKLHNFDYFDGLPQLGARRVFLQRSSQLENLAVLEVPGSDPSPAGSEFVQKLLLQCAHSLVTLETSARAHVFKRMKQLGLSSLPKLRSFRHVPFEDESYTDIAVDLGLVDLPSLEMVEAPFAVVSTMSKIPPRVCFQIRDNEDVDRIAKWLRTLDDANSLRELRLESFVACGYELHLRSLVDALTPSKARKVFCAQLNSFAYVRRDEILRHGTETSPFNVESSQRAKPVFDDAWDYKVDASCVARMEVERRRVSEGLPPVAPKRSSSRPPTASTSSLAPTQRKNPHSTTTRRSRSGRHASLYAPSSSKTVVCSRTSGSHAVVANLSIRSLSRPRRDQPAAEVAAWAPAPNASQLLRKRLLISCLSLLIHIAHFHLDTSSPSITTSLSFKSKRRRLASPQRRPRVREPSVPPSCVALSHTSHAQTRRGAWHTQ